ncbi:MAG: enoyl-CoA hydratase/isomerase family protein [bacterium]
MSYETILTENIDSILLITLNRPERLNAWTYQMGAELRRAIEAGNADEEVTAMVVTGAGRGFCAGADIEAVFKAQSDGADTPRESVGDWVTLVRESKPMVAAINGAAVGVGLTQVLPMDYLVAADSAKLSVRFVKMGLVPELASSRFLFARCGWGQASELMLSGKTLPAAAALEIGLVDKVVAPEDLVATACETAAGMGENPQSSLRAIKALISANAGCNDYAEVQQREMAALREAYTSSEHKEAIAAFMEKREPDFKRARQEG